MLLHLLRFRTIRSRVRYNVFRHALWKVAATGTTKHPFQLFGSLPEAPQAHQMIAPKHCPVQRHYLSTHSKIYISTLLYDEDDPYFLKM